MSNDKTTLADVQPGGRVRLGDQAQVTISDDLLSSMAYAIPGAVETTDKAKAVAARVVEVYLSAQPSPRGQDERAQFEEYRGGDCERDAQGYYVNARTAQDWAMWQAALAASHPVRIYGCCAQPEGELHTAECPNMRHLAARQPVGEPVAVPGTPTSCKHCDSTELQWFAHIRALNQVPHGRLTTHDVGCDFVLGCEECSATLRVVKADEIAALLNAAQPAQAVDLAPDHCGMRVDYHGLLRQVQSGLRCNPELAEMVRQLHDHLTVLGKRWYAGDRKVVDEFLQLYVIEDGARRALIDSQAVGNG